MVVLRGKTDFILKSDRQNPRRFGTLETAMTEVRHLGLQRCEVNLETWAGKMLRSVKTPLNLAVRD